MGQETRFSPSAIAALIAFGVLSFLGASYFALIHEQPPRAGSNVFSVSAVGHKAFVELMKRRGVPVIISRNNSVAKAGDRSLLILAEPHRVPDPLELAGNTLVILPKRVSAPDPDHSGWVREAPLANADAVQRIAKQFVSDAAIVRGPAHEAWRIPTTQTIRRWNSGALPDVTLREHMLSREVPQLDSVQLIRSSTLEPILSTARGILVGAMILDGKALYVISDPDLMSNAGIGRGDNAALMLDLIGMMRPLHGSVVVDEVIHGFQRTPNLWRMMFELPFIAVTALGFVALGVLIWAASGRFGAAIAPPPSRTATESDLIENAVGLLHQAGHDREITGAYPAILLRDVAQQLHAPRNQSPNARIDWIDRIGGARRARARYRDLARDIETAAAGRGGSNASLLRSVQRLFDWKQELTHGPERH